MRTSWASRVSVRDAFSFLSTDHFPSLDTGADYVQQTLANYITSLQSTGVAGLRLDAAKRTSDLQQFDLKSENFACFSDVNTAEIASILSRLAEKPYITQEVTLRFPMHSQN